MSAIVKPAQLRPGDVLLYHGDSLVSRLIRLFDGTNYSHASIWDGKHVVEALFEGVAGRPLKASVAGTPYVDCFRYRNGKTGRMLGEDSAPLPAKPVLAQAAAFEKEASRYAYEEVLLLALLAATRQATAPIPFLGMILRNILDHAADELARLMAAGKEPLICSELVFRCYDQAGTAYQIRIRGADVAMKHAAVAMTTATPMTIDDPSGYHRAAAAFLENYEAAKRTALIHAPSDAVMAAASAAPITTQAVANFVTPGDLKNSPDVQLVGRLSV